MRNGEDPRIIGARCWCNECGWEVEFGEGVYSHAPIERSATARIAVHIRHYGCDTENTGYELTYAEIEFGDTD